MIVQNDRLFRAGRIGGAGRRLAASNAPICGARRRLPTFKLDESPEDHMLRRAIALTIGICLSVAGQHTGAPAGDRSPTVGETHPADVVLARRVLMTGIGRNMDEITGMIEDGGVFSLGEAREHADLISTMLLAFPHLFPIESNTWSEKLANDDPAHVSLALPTVWRNYDDFARPASLADRPRRELRRVCRAIQGACEGIAARLRFVSPILQTTVGPLRQQGGKREQ
jgi:cytochrome c556